jgi:hypothetical protein
LNKSVIRLLLALAVVGAVVGGVAALNEFGGGDLLHREATADLSPVTVSLFFGGEKTGILQDPEIVEILKKRYHITLDAQKAGSIEQATDSGLLAQKRDCRWPSNQVAYDLYSEATHTAQRQQNIFNSPIVIYTWAPTAAALTKAGLVEQRNGISYITKTADLLVMAEDHKPWKDFGLPYFGSVKIATTDPTRSNSGNMFAALLATVLNNGDVVDEAAAARLAPRLVTYFKSLGEMDRTSSDSFEAFLAEGEGGRPLTVGYESQIAEYALQHPEALTLLRQKIVTLYPLPTMWSSHPLIAETPRCNRLIDAMEDKDIQRLAWERHGFRSGLIGVSNDPKVLTVAGIPESIDSVVPMPKADAIGIILDALRPQNAARP